VVVLEQDPPLRAEWAKALAVQDRWARRSALRGLAPRIAGVSVSVSEPQMRRWKTTEWGGLTVLEPGQYHPIRGLISEREG
jgi:hypothetical protein